MSQHMGLAMKHLLVVGQLTEFAPTVQVPGGRVEAARTGKGLHSR